MLQGENDRVTEQTEPELNEWSVFNADEAAVVWRKFSPRAQAVFSLLMDNPGIAIPADEIAAKIGLTNGRHGLSRHCRVAEQAVHRTALPAAVPIR